MIEPKSRWYVITGGFSSGKTTAVGCLAEMGFETVPDASRVLIDEALSKNISAEELRRDEQAYQRVVLTKKMEVERRLPRNKLLFLDRGVPCSIAYYFLLGMNPQEVAKVCERGLYAGVFLMEQLPYKKDYARTETEEFMRSLTKPLEQAYTNLGYNVIVVPAMATAEDRAQFILARCNLGA